MCRSGRASFNAGIKSLFIFKKGFSQLTYKDFLQNGDETVENVDAVGYIINNLRVMSGQHLFFMYNNFVL